MESLQRTCITGSHKFPDLWNQFPSELHRIWAWIVAAYQ